MLKKTGRLLLGMLLVLPMAGPVHGVMAEQGDERWKDHHLVLENQIVSDYGPYGYASLSNGGDSAILGWNESLVLDSYFELYRTTGERSHLDKLIDHMDYSLSMLSNHDGDGYAGWHTSRYVSRTMPSNNGFDEPLLDMGGEDGEMNIPVDLNKWVAGSGSDSSKIITGSPEADIILESGSGAPKLYYYMTSYLPDTEHVLTLEMKTDNPAVGARMYLYDWESTPGAILKDNSESPVPIDAKKTNTEWQTVEYRFETPSYVNRIGIVLMHLSPAVEGGQAYFRNIRLTAFPQGEQPAEPEGWARLPGANAQHTYISPTEGYNGGSGLVILSDGEQEQGVQAYIKQYVPNKLHSLTFKARTDGLPAGGRLAIKNETTGQWLTDVDGEALVMEWNELAEWTTFERKFLMPDSGETLSVALQNADPEEAGAVYVDDVVIAQAAEYIVHEASMYTPMMKFVKEAYENEGLAEELYEPGVTYMDKANQFLPFAIEFVDKWEPYWRDIPGTTEGVYLWTDDEASAFPGNTLPHNQYIKMVPVLLPLHEVTGEADYREKAEKMLRFFKNQLRLHETAAGEPYYAWNYYDPAFSDEISQTIKAEDVSHGNLDVEAALAGYDRGLVFDETDMIRFANTYHQLVWNGDLLDPQVYRFLEPNPSSSYYYLNWPYNHDSLRDWVRLSPWNHDIYLSFAALFETPTLGSTASKMAVYAYMNTYLNENPAP